MIFSSSDVLSVGQLKRLAEHKYSTSGSTLLDPIMQPFWNWLVLKFPIWVAPNLMTIAGLIVNIITSLILVYYSPDARHNAPWWTFLLCGLGLFIYQTLDALDGKQARRTGSSSPLGELFDHGCDSVSTVFVTLGICIAVQLGSYPSLMFFQCFATISLFYCAHWQTYVSGTLRFGKFDVTEVQFSVIGVHLISAIFGPSFWSTQIPFINLELRFVPFIGQVIGSTVALCSYCSVIFTGGAGKNGSTVAIPFLHVEFRLMPVVLALSVTFLMCYNYIAVILSGGVGKNGSTVAGTSVLSPFIPMGLVVLPAFIIYQKSKFNVYENHPCLYILAFGFVAAKVTNRLVIAHMTKSEMSYLDSVLVGPGMLFLNQYFNFFIPEYAVLWLCLVYAGADLLHYCFIVCNQICYHLNIHLFKITPKSATAASKSETIPINSPRVANVLNTSNDPCEILDHDTAPYQQLSPNDDENMDNYDDLEQEDTHDRQHLLPK